MKKKLLLVCTFIMLLAFGLIVTRYYSFIFARPVKGQVIGIDRVTQPSAILNAGGQIPAAQIFSFAVAIRDDKGEIVTASSEDRQWAVAEKGQCAEAKFLPYPPWQLEKAGTYFGARLLKLYDCPSP